ncbi:MAG: type II secretion system protein GspD [Planctomycetes bacterium]|nr:type II secretion system protein GspD [Planctomycetota bacterium]
MWNNKNANIKKRIRYILLVCGFILAVTVSVSSAEITENAVHSITFKENTEITDALRLLAVKYNKNIVPSAEVAGQLAFTRLFDVTFENAINAVLGDKFKYDQQGNLIKVYGADEYEIVRYDKDRITHKVFTLYYISAAEAKKLISPLLSSAGKIEATNAAEVGVPVSETISSTSTGGDTTAMNDTIVVYDFPENIKKAERIIASIDIRPKQVLIEATILSAKLTEDTQFGIDWGMLQETAVSSLSGVTRGTSYLASVAGTSRATKTTGLTVGLAIDDVAAFIRAVEEVTDVTILANPKILAVNKQLGQVYIGTKVAYESQTTQSDGGLVTTKVEFLDTGTKLSFRPYIGDDGYIRMDIHPKDSSSVAGSAGPDETSAELVTNIIVKDGQTIVIGGLFRDEVTTKRTQIPMFGDLPFVGAAFRGTSDETKRHEVMVLLTPHIISEPGQTQGDERAEDVARKRFGAKDGLQWLGRARLAEDRYAKAAQYYVEGNDSAALREVKLALEIRPTYLEAIRLKERIILKTEPEKAVKNERIVLSDIDQKESSKWRRID